MLSRLLSGNPAARHDSRLRRLLPKFDAHPQRMHLREMGIESHISRTRGKFNGANSTHYILCTDEVRGMRCRLSSDADGETDTLASPEHFAFYQPLLVLNPNPPTSSLPSAADVRTGTGSFPFAPKLVIQWPPPLAVTACWPSSVCLPCRGALKITSMSNWPKDVDACRNCGGSSDRLRHGGRVYCHRCYYLVRKGEAAEQWAFQERSSLGPHADYLMRLPREEFDIFKRAYLSWLEGALGTLRIREEHRRGPVTGLDLEGQLGAVVKLLNREG